MQLWEQLLKTKYSYQNGKEHGNGKYIKKDNNPTKDQIKKKQLENPATKVESKLMSLFKNIFYI